MLSNRQANCPHCGGPIEFKLGSAVALVCDFCRASVVRVDQALHTLGQLAQLVPTTPFLSVGDEGQIAGQRFRVGGRLQLDHGQGPWDEWYVEYEDGHWGWLALAQGLVYATEPQTVSHLPSWEDCPAGTEVELEGQAGTFVVTQRGGSALLSAQGELPFPAVPLSSGRYLDAEGPDQGFATIDYGDGSEPPQLYVGKRHPANALTCERMGVGPRPTEKVATERLRCPQCGAPVPVTQPDATHRISCESCDSLLDHSEGALHYLAQIQKPAGNQWIPLGSSGNLRGEDVVVLGFVERWEASDDPEFEYREYLLYTPAGYRYLVEDEGHFTYYTERLSAADVRCREPGIFASYDKKTYVRYGQAMTKVHTVRGEFFYQIAQGDLVISTDFVKYPYMLSREESNDEFVWSRGTYMPSDELWKALSLPDQPPKARGTSPIAPNPHRPGRLLLLGLLFTLLLGLLHTGLVASKTGPAVVDMSLRMPERPYPTQPAPELTQTSSGFEIASGPTTMEVTLHIETANAWVGINGALVNETTGDVRMFYLEAEQTSSIAGYSTAKGYLGSVMAGRYSMRFLPTWANITPLSSKYAAVPRATVSAKPGPRRLGLAILLSLLLLLPGFLEVIRYLRFSQKRYSGANVGFGDD